MNIYDFSRAVDRSVEAFRRALAERGVLTAVFHADFDTIAEGYAVIDLRSNRNVGAIFELWHLSNGGVFLALAGFGEPVGQGTWTDRDEMVDIIANAATFGVVWAGAPFRRIPVFIAPQIPASADEYRALRERGCVRYDVPWESSESPPPGS